MDLTNQEAVDATTLDELVNATEMKIGEYFSQSDITDISILKQCINLEKLKVWNTKIVDLPLNNTLKLKEFKTYKCKNLLSLNGLQTCSEIEEIFIHTLKIKSVIVLRDLKKLQKVTIQYCKQLTNYDPLEDCINLNYLFINFTNISDISPIARLQNIETLYLRDNNLLPQEFQKYININKHDVTQLLISWRQTQHYKNYNTNKFNQQQNLKYNQLRASLKQTLLNINHFKEYINNKIYQYKISLVKSMQKIIELQE